MSKKYQTYWKCRGRRIDDLAEVRQLLDAGEMVISEVSAESQRQEAERIAQAEQRRAEALEATLPPYRVRTGPE